MRLAISKSTVSAFTILELFTCVVVIAILITLLVSVVKGTLDRAEFAGCSTNLRSIGVAATQYTVDHGHWPQISSYLIKADNKAYAKAWIEALEPYKLSQQNWLCPSVQRTMNRPDMSDPENTRVDYIAMPFDDKQNTPFRWPKHPWFVERGNVHGDGNLMLLTNGRIVPANEFLPKAQ
jgi:type II secretory pathway pseudopilin PulG